ncbi:HNH endonuclease [Coraliomargarita sp. W4R72]
MYCFHCGQALNDRPELLISGKSYCFKCAKKRYSNRSQCVELKEKCERQSMYAIIAAGIGCFLFNFFGFIALAGVLYKRNDELKGLGLYMNQNPNINRGKSSWNTWGFERIPIRYSYFKGIEKEEVRLCDHGLDPLSSFEDYSRAAIIARDRSKCQICERKFESKELEMHHVRPRKFNGSNSERNLVTLCIPCHMKETWFGHYHAGNSRSGRSRW